MFIDLVMIIDATNQMGFHIAFTKLMKIHESIKMINVPFSEKV